MCYIGSKEREMKKLVVCGDSFGFSAYKSDWPVLVSKKLNYELENLSIVGSSNIGICFQLEYALKNLSPDLIIIILTTAERFEIDSDDKKTPVSIEDFKYDIDEIKTKKWNKTPSIVSGRVICHLQNSDTRYLKHHIMSHSYRLSAQKQSWCLQHHFNNINCNFLVYRGIYPQYHEDKANYASEYYFGLEKYLTQSGPYDYENERCESTNHLNVRDNKLFADKVLKDLKSKKYV